MVLYAWKPLWTMIDLFRSVCTFLRMQRWSVLIPRSAWHLAVRKHPQGRTRTREEGQPPTGLPVSMASLYSESPPAASTGSCQTLSSEMQVFRRLPHRPAPAEPVLSAKQGGLLQNFPADTSGDLCADSRRRRPASGGRPAPEMHTKCAGTPLYGFQVSRVKAPVDTSGYVSATECDVFG